MRRTRRGALTSLIAVLGGAIVSCTLTTSLDGLEGPPLAELEGGTASDASDAPRPAVDAASAYASCATLPAGSPDGFYAIDPDGAGPRAAFLAYCDMTNDGGGWMLVTADLLGNETSVEATVTRDRDKNGGVIMTVYVNSPGCGTATPSTRHRIFIVDAPAWTRVRYHQKFFGYASCWHIFGGQEVANTPPLDPNLVPFDKNVDTIRDELRMGGKAGDAFDGVPSRCNEDPFNFWAMVNGTDPREATVVVRRRVATAPGGLETGADCGESGAGTTSALFWEYRDIFVR